VNGLGLARRMRRLASRDGFFFVAALDHPENYVALLGPDASYETVVASKLSLAAALAEHASALLLDPVWSLGQAIATGVAPGGVGLIAPIEQLVYTPQRPPGWAVEPTLRPHWTVAKIDRLGVDAVKFIIFYRADLEDAAAAQRKLVATLADQCRERQLPLVIEPIWYPLPGEDGAGRSAAIVAAAAEFGRLGADILKVQYPGSASAAAALDEAVDVPWVLLSEGAGFDDFAVQMEICARAGASGYIAGRAVWGDAVGTGVYDEAVARLRTLNDIVRRHGRPWAPRTATLGADWYLSYNPADPQEDRC